MSHLTKIAVLAVLAALAGCEKKPSDAKELLTQNPPPADTSSDAAQAVTLAPGQASLLKLDGVNKLMHAELPEPTCAQRSEAVISWDAAATGNERIELWVGPEGARQIVAAGGGKDKAVIPGWASPGQIFTLRTLDGKQELDKLLLPGNACP